MYLPRFVDVRPRAKSPAFGMYLEFFLQRKLEEFGGVIRRRLFWARKRGAKQDDEAPQGFVRQKSQ